MQSVSSPRQAKRRLERRPNLTLPAAIHSPASARPGGRGFAVILNPRSGCQHKARGGAQRSGTPGTVVQEYFKARGAGDSRSLRLTLIATAVARFAGSIVIGGLILGLYAFACSAGYAPR
jgi:hypothetical protein